MRTNPIPNAAAMISSVSVKPFGLLVFFRFDLFTFPSSYYSETVAEVTGICIGFTPSCAD